MLIRPLHPVADLDLVEGFYHDAPDYWLLAEGGIDVPAKAHEFFIDCPPGSDPAKSHRLGLFLGDRLSGLAELSFAFPKPEDAYLGLMILGPWAQGGGHGVRFLAHIEGLVRLADCPRLYLGVLDRNPKGLAFWTREGFQLTGDFRVTDQGDRVHRMVRSVQIC